MAQIKNVFGAVMYTSLLVLQLLYVTAFSQQVSWSEPSRSENRYLKIIGQDEEGFYVLKSNMALSDNRLSSGFRKREYELEYYSDDMNRKWNKLLEPLSREDKLVGVAFFGGKIVVVNVHFRDDSKKYTISLQAIGNKGLPEGSPVTAAELSYEKKSEIEDFRFIISQDHSNLLLVQEGNTKDEEEKALLAILIGENLRPLYSKVVRLPSEKPFIIKEIVVSRDKDLLVLSKNTGKKSDKTAGTYELFVYSFGSDSLSAATISVENKFLTAASVAADPINKKLIVAGFYSDQTTYSIAGTFYLGVDRKTMQITAVKTEPFDPRFLTRVVGESGADRKELTNYFVDRLVLRNDGGAVVIAESFYTSTSTYYDVFLQSYMSRMNYHYNSILTLSINPDGSLHWPQVVNKSQTSVEDGGFYSSYCSLAYQNRIYFIYNDISGRSVRVMLTYINNNGQLVNNVLFEGSEEIVLIPRAARQIDENVIIIPGERKGKFSYLKLSF
jgi:hypothetical protein